jgi:hypothetical protein
MDEDILGSGLGGAATSDPYSSEDPWLGGFFDNLFDYSEQGLSIAERISQLFKKNQTPQYDPRMYPAQNNTLIYLVVGVAVIGLLIWLLKK